MFIISIFFFFTRQDETSLRRSWFRLSHLFLNSFIFHEKIMRSKQISIKRCLRAYFLTNSIQDQCNERTKTPWKWQELEAFPLQESWISVKEAAKEFFYRMLTTFLYLPNFECTIRSLRTWKPNQKEKKRDLWLCFTINENIFYWFNVTIDVTHCRLHSSTNDM